MMVDGGGTYSKIVDTLETLFFIAQCDVWLGEERDATIVGQYIIGNLF